MNPRHLVLETNVLPTELYPYILQKWFRRTPKTPYRARNILGQALDRLVAASSARRRASTSALSTSSSPRGLTAVAGTSHLGVGFALRCLQRLSLPDLAALPCPWWATGSPAVRPARSSRTRARPPQMSYARAG